MYPRLSATESLPRTTILMESLLARWKRRLWIVCSSFSRQRCCLWIWSIVREGSKRAASTQHQTSPRPCFGLVTRCTRWLCSVLLNSEDLDNKTYFQELVHFTSECTNMTLPDCFCWSTVREVRQNFQSRCMNSSGGWKRKSVLSAFGE